MISGKKINSNVFQFANGNLLAGLKFSDDDWVEWHRYEAKTEERSPEYRSMVKTIKTAKRHSRTKRLITNKNQ